jgi:hypothetical protein
MLVLAGPRLSLILHRLGTALFSKLESLLILCAMILPLLHSCTICTDMLLTLGSAIAPLDDTNRLYQGFRLTT